VRKAVGARRTADLYLAFHSSLGAQALDAFGRWRKETPAGAG
jgi:hypothetical protein